MNRPPKAVLFDCDGVLVDSEVITNRIMLKEFAERGLGLTMDEMLEISLGNTMEGVAAEAARRGARIEDGWVAQFYLKAFEALEREVEAVPGVSDVIDRLHARGVAMAVASNGPVAKMQITLRRAGLLDRLTPHIFSARDLAHPKPAPDIYLHAAAVLGVSPTECAVIEDSASGAKAGQAAGMRCIGFAQATDAAKLRPYCHDVVQDMTQVAKLLHV